MTCSLAGKAHDVSGLYAKAGLKTRYAKSWSFTRSKKSTAYC
jgi:hypothetical protein